VPLQVAGCPTLAVVARVGPLPGAPFKPVVGLSGVVAVPLPLPLHLLLPLLLTSEASLY
jgi:hypothetical protein